MTLDWGALLSDSKVMAVLEKLLASNVQSISPTVSSDGRIVYGGVSDALGDDAVPVLEALTAAGALEKRSEARLLGCPVHENSVDLMPRFKCANCSSMLIKKGTLLQHICGHIGPIESFGGNCPKCGKPSPEQTLKLMGSWYECEECKTRSAAPTVFLYCKKFHHDFPAVQAKLIDEGSYTLTAEAAADLRQRVGPMIGLIQALRAKGFQVQLSGQIGGASGVQHNFDFIIGVGDKAIPVDVKVAAEGGVEIVSVLSTYAKVLDVKAKTAFLVAIPAASADSKRTAAAYGLLLVEGKTQAEVVANFLAALEKERVAGGPGAVRVESAKSPQQSFL